MQNKLNILIQNIEEKAKLEDIVSDYINLERRGANYWGLCPFHSDTNASMSVSPEKKIFKCFSCGASGNMFKFVQNHEGINFIEAVKKIATKYGIDYSQHIEERVQKVDPEKEKAKEINKEALNFMKYNIENEMNSGSDVDKYLKERNLTKEIIEKYSIGYIGQKPSLSEYLINKGYEASDVIRAGLAKIDDNGDIKNYFFNRIMFPIHDEFGNVIAFSGRALSSKSFAKYLNSPETKLFKKSSTLYNLNRSISPISLKNEIIVVEGFMDVIAYDRLGIQNVIATMGTSFTKEHIERISKITKNYVLSFDSDVAGINTALEAGNKLFDGKNSVKVVELVGAKDLDELVQKKSKQEVLDIIKESKTFINFYLDLLIKNKKSEPDFSAIKKFIRLVERTGDEMMISHYVNRISDEFGIDKESLRLDKTQEITLSPGNTIHSQYKKQSSKKLNYKIDDNQVRKMEYRLMFLAMTDEETMNTLNKSKYYFNDSNIRRDFRSLMSNKINSKNYIGTKYEDIAKKYLNSSEVKPEGDVNSYILKQISRISEYTTMKSKRNALAELRGKPDDIKEEVLKKVIKN